MTTAGDGLPGTTTRRPTDWNATDELGYFYTDPGRDAAHPFFADALRDHVMQQQGIQHHVTPDRAARNGASQNGGEPVAILQAGCLAPMRELGVSALKRDGFDISVTVADEDTPLTRKVLGATREFYDDVVTGDLRSLSIGQRAFDVVYCGGLLERIRNTELVLDHLVSTLKPGGLLMIRMADRRTALALLDRTLPAPLRKRMWADLRPGVPGPFPAVYERTVSADGMHAYTLMRGLVIAQQTAEPTLQANPARLSSTVRVTCTVITRLTRGRFGDDHDELLYVIRKPQDRFARVV
ncbi:MAG TPA: methyltransferase domain-containing protein [Trebonia sp.]